MAGIIKTTAELAEVFSVTTKTIRLWINNGMPVVVEGKQGAGNESQIDLEAAVRWYFEENREKLELDRQRARLAEEQADKHALENAVRRGEVGIVAEMVDFYGQHIDRAQRRLQQIPQTLGQYCDERNAAAVITAASRLIDECVRELAADEGAIPVAAAQEVAASTDADGQSVVGSVSNPKRRKQRRAGPVEN